MRARVLACVRAGGRARHVCVARARARRVTNYSYNVPVPIWHPFRRDPRPARVNHAAITRLLFPRLPSAVPQLNCKRDGFLFFIRFRDTPAFFHAAGQKAEAGAMWRSAFLFSL